MNDHIELKSLLEMFAKLSKVNMAWNLILLKTKHFTPATHLLPDLPQMWCPFGCVGCLYGDLGHWFRSQRSLIYVR